MASESSDKRPLRPLLPALPRDRRPPPAPPQPFKKANSYRQTYSSVVTELAQCTGERPRCRECILRDTACEYPHKYEALKSSMCAHKGLLELLKTMSEPESLELLRKIRAGESVESILKHVEDGNLLLQLALTPETRHRNQFPYMRDMPQFLQRPDNPHLESIIYDWTAGPSSKSKQHEAAKDNYITIKSSYLKPFHAAVLVDSVLDSLKPSKWTSVSIDDRLMRGLLRKYFLREHMWFTYINKNLFLEDMASGSEEFCSPLLVNALLAFACHCHRDIARRFEYWNPLSMGYKFLAEAKRLWELEEWRSKITTIQAALFLNGICNLDGVDMIGWKYTARAVAMGNELGIFTAPKNETSARLRIAYESTAWTLFCWQGIVSYVMFRPPLLHNPPEAPLPAPTANPQWYGDFWIRYPLDQTPTPAQHGHDFKTRAELIVIINEIAMHYFTDPNSRDSRSMETILKFYSKLTRWYDNLPERLTVKKIVLPSQLKIHMKYYNVLVNLFQPLVENKPNDTDLAAFIKAVNQTPQEAISTATVRLETLFRIYYLRHGFEAMDAYLLHFLNTLGYVAMETVKEDTDTTLVDHRRCLILMCALGLREQGQYYYLVRTIFHLFRNSISPEDVNLLKHYAQDVSPEKDELFRPQDLISQYPLNFVNISNDPEKHRVTYFVKAMDNLLLSSEQDGAV